MIKHLEWDSKFFSWKTGLIVIDTLENIEDKLSECKKNKYRLIYVFSNINCYLENDVLFKYNGKLIDKKVVFFKTIYQDETLKFNRVTEYEKLTANNTLIELALQSGQYSRFKTDPNFNTNEFERMYKNWIEKSVKKEIADYIFITKNQDIITGMVTLKIIEEKAQIGLIATSPLYQGLGNGRQLVHKCIEIAKTHNCSIIEVPTQQDNTQACNFYKACGFKVQNINLIYHFWL